MKNGPYELIIPPEEYPGRRYRGRYCYEHHFVWWENTGELVQEGETVHHKDGKKRNNAFENLEKLTREEHTSQHNREKGIATMTLICHFCKEEFSRQVRQVNKNQKNYYCDRSCMAKQFRKVKCAVV